MQHPETRLALHHARATDLRAQAETHRLTARARQPYELRARLGWTLVEIGLRLATPKPPALAH
ncbi:MULTISPECIES: hypothetical protein [unclassified Streptomyces]|uniref:hypothetical protein n=1 Tax=unclassified Streptomyces TaxID=2593676 RepID=UPI00236501F8|nr:MULTISPECIES: hypothetical protein [unclassified Streptomyces]MDF3143158.1 hypothetical protein [Streptomyces sp. T21Q-yed]WDF38454.1 hypothetical protein PBV52_17440 [Streptomyces sp. T12]